MGSLLPASSPGSKPQPPNPSIRSTKGCWTCRLRKKKCDETPFACLRCEAASLECRYGARPSWIESPELGRSELERIKGLVAVTASRKRAEHRARAKLKSKTASAVVLVDSYLSPGSLGSGSRFCVSTAAGEKRSIVLEDQVLTTSPEEVVIQKGGSSGRLELSSWIKDHEADLIMHYLDHVFYIQFRFYVPSVSTGGRGWVLSLITKTKPQYHAALSLAAFHQQSLMLQENGGSDDCLSLVELEQQHNLTLQEMQRFIQVRCESSDTSSVSDINIQILACVVQLISFELFKGGASNWSVHLKAGCDLVLMIYEQTLQQKGLPSQFDEWNRGDQTSSVESNALRFFTGCIIWFDILSCVSTSKPPHVAAHHRQLLLGTASYTAHSIGLHNVCGAQHWVLLLISEIAALAYQNQWTSWRRVVDFDTQSFEAAAKDVGFRLTSHHRQLREELTALRRQHNGSPSHSLPEIYAYHTILVVTSIFASAAAIYFQTATVRSPDISPDLVRLPLLDIIDAMKMISDYRVFRGLVWPLCVAGCMASLPGDQEFFRDKSKGAVSDAKSFGNSTKALEILEKSWELQRKSGMLVNCSTVLKELGTCVLLV